VQIPTELGTPPSKHFPLETQSAGPKTLGFVKADGAGHAASSFPAGLAQCIPEKLHFRLPGQITFSARAETLSRVAAKTIPKCWMRAMTNSRLVKSKLYRFHFRKTLVGEGLRCVKLKPLVINYYKALTKEMVTYYLLKLIDN